MVMGILFETGPGKLKLSGREKKCWFFQICKAKKIPIFLFFETYFKVTKYRSLEYKFTFWLEYDKVQDVLHF